MEQSRKVPIRRVLCADGDLQCDAIPEHMRGYRDEACRVTELKLASRITLYESDSSGSDHSSATHTVDDTIRELMSVRATLDCGICRIKPAETSACNDRLLTRAAAVVRRGALVFRSADLGAARKQVRRCSGIIELLPGWFTLQRIVATCNDVRRLDAFVRHMFSQAEYERRMTEFIARHPLRHVACSPTIQNLRGRQFLTIVLLYYARHNGCELDTPFILSLRQGLPETVNDKLFCIGAPGSDDTSRTPHQKLQWPHGGRKATT